MVNKWSMNTIEGSVLGISTSSTSRSELRESILELGLVHWQVHAEVGIDMTRIRVYEFVSGGEFIGIVSGQLNIKGSVGIRSELEHL